jgi:hypothetical protein
MSLYPKQLRSIDDLEREKSRLKKQLEKLGDEDAFSVSSLLGSASKGEKKGKVKDEAGEAGGNGGFLASLIPMALPFVEIGIQMVQNKMAAPKAEKPKKDKKQLKEPAAEKGESRNVLKAMAIEIVTGYLKWKAIELSYRGAKHLIKKRKERQALEELEKEMS